MSDMDSSFIGKFRGFLFKNKHAKTDSHPAFQGRFVFTPEQIRRLSNRTPDDKGEVVCEAAAWLRKDKNQNGYYFVSVNADSAPKVYSPPSEDGDSDDIPF